MNKKPWQSKTNWVAFIMAGCALLIPGFSELVSDNPQVSVVVGAVIMAGLRLISRDSISLK